MNSNIFLLWDMVTKYGYNIRKNSKDGLKGWEALKSIIPILSIEWSDKSKTFYKDLGDIGVDLSESSEEAKMTKEQWERHHYLLQHGRIIKKNPDGDLRRLMQIAYNAGQFKCELEKETYNLEQIRYYIINDLNKVTTYINKTISVPDIIIDQISELNGEPKIGGLHKRGGKKSINEYLENYINYII